MEHLRITVVCEVENDLKLQQALSELLREHGVNDMTIQQVHNTLLHGAIMQEMQRGRADVDITPVR